MDYYIQNIFTAVLFAECFMGIALNMFIVAVYFMRWKALKSLETRDKILTSLGISRSLFMANVLIAYLMRSYFTWILKSILFNIGILLCGMLLHSTDLWITTVLCVFYCVKIANYSHELLTYMKTRISRLVPRFILASLLISLASSIPIIQYGLVLHTHNSTHGFLGNSTTNNANIGYAFLGQVIIFLLGSLLPFLVFCGAVYLLIRSL
ncbi:PREDICTED: taste receptor type 2 member 4-like [Nanorana parkeri]|uniref:taste receptor type 2 member 4-like n=1 Tax=Nanorana parkeri TaxID=125878 RepID=UPI000854D921|nr:PREDICTED: taste receptor type 2 member 4-like [Nanorana parkeri]